MSDRFPEEESPPPKDASSSSFDATRWTLVHRAQVSSAERGQALADLCEAYWKPVFRFLRSEGRGDDEARELTQEFFAGILEKGKLGVASSSRGKFRSYLLGAVKHFLSDRRKAAGREKRGGDLVFQSLDAGAGVDPNALPADTSSPAIEPADPAANFDARYFDQQWAYVLLDRVLARLEAEFESAAKQQQWEALKPWLTGEQMTELEKERSDSLGLSPTALKVAVHRLRKRYRALVREEIAQTVVSEAEVSEELRYLLSVLSIQPEAKTKTKPGSPK